jgi:hypothetical protein
MARFDWYQGTVRASVPDIRACLSGLAVGGAWEPLRKAPHGYAFGDRLVDADGPVGMLWWGGTHAHPHAVVSGEAAQAAAELLRADFPDHSVSRADPCIDYAEAGAYERLQGLAVGVARDRKVKVGTAGDHLVTMEGRTVYLGATSSHTRLRLYDKAAELRGKFAADPVRLATVPAELARLECQVRPQTAEAKRAAAVADPISLMGSAAWMRELMRHVAGLDLEPFVAGKVWRQSDDDRAYAAVLAQYGGLFRRMAAVQGWECIGPQIRDDLAEREEAAGRR